MSEHKRYFHVSYNTGDSIGEALFSTSGGRYLNRISAINHILSILNREPVARLAIIGITEMTESDYMDYTAGSEQNS